MTLEASIYVFETAQMVVADCRKRISKVLNEACIMYSATQALLCLGLLAFGPKLGQKDE